MDEDKTVEISGQTVAIGTPVNVLWLDTWYEGKVIELGRNDLFKVRDTNSNLIVLLEQSQIKVIDKTRPTHEQYSPGSEVAYYDNGLCTWLTAIIEEAVSQESVYVKWQRNDSANFNLNWFDIDHVAPIISNEAYGIETQEVDHYDNKTEKEEGEDEGEEGEEGDVVGEINTMASKSKLQLPSMNKIATLEEVLEERPRHRKNSMFQDVGNMIGGSGNTNNGFQKPFENRPPASFIEEFDSSKHVKSHRTSVSMKHFYSDTFNSGLSQHNDNQLDRYVQTQKALLHGTVDHSLLPPVWSYFSSHKGIPHHPSSRFFRQRAISESRLTRSAGQYYGSQGWVRPPSASQSVVGTKSERHFNHQGLSRSTTMNSDPNSDLSPYAQVFFSQGKHRPLKRYATDMSSRPLPELPSETNGTGEGFSPYEVPLPLSSPSSWANLQQKKAKPNMYHYTPHLEKFDELISPSDVKAPTIVSTSKNEMMVSAGGTITLFCEASSDTPVTYEWIKNGHKLTNNDDRVAFPAPGSLQLYGLCIADAGTYQCQVSNEGGIATYKCELYVEEESLKKSFSREYGLDKLAKDLPGFEDTTNRQIGRRYSDNSLTSISLDEPDDDFHSQAPAYDDYPLNMVRHTLSLASMNATIEQDQATFILSASEEDGQIVADKNKKKKKESTKERKTKKDKRRRVSNVLMDVDDYLEGYGQDYGHMTDEQILASAIINKDGKKKSKEKSKSKLKKEKKDKKKKKNQKDDEITTQEDDKKVVSFTTSTPQHLDSPQLVKPQLDKPTQLDTITTTTTNEPASPPPPPPPSSYPVISVEAEVVLEYEEGMVREEGEGEESVDVVQNQNDEIEESSITGGVQLKDTAHSQDSIHAHPSYDSLLDDDEVEEGKGGVPQEREAGEGREEEEEDQGEHLVLPQETQHYTEGVKRLQESNEEYEKQHGFTKEDSEDKKQKRSSLSKIFKPSSNKEDNNILTMI